MKRRLKITPRLALSIAAGSCLALGLTLAIVLVGLQKKITKRLEQGWVLTPLELYAQGLPLSVGRKLARAELDRELKSRDLRAERDYLLSDPPACAARAGLDLSQSAATHCLWLKTPSLVVTWDDAEWIRDVYLDGQPRAYVPLFPRLITQFFDGHPILQQNTALGQVPLSCLQAVTAIEDRDFLEHRGVSATGTLRALVRNLTKGRWAEGGSTITQQLVKNFFLNPKKTLKRKFEEQGLAILLESQIGKDQIFEMYLNVIYMGQSGPYQVRGFGSAARQYFDRAIEDLDLPDCALLAALINSPGRYSPFEHPAGARQRRELVLTKMRGENMISEDEFARANAAALPPASANRGRVHAPFFVMSALREFQGWEIESDEGVRLYTTLDAEAQVAMVEAVERVAPVIEKRVRKPSTQPLQVAAVTVDLDTAEILALIGGRDYRVSQYNRATDARRQIGSTIKPFVYYPAMRSSDPLTSVTDEPFEWKTGRQTWRPKNYERGSAGAVPYFLALAESLNVPAAKVGQLVGLKAVARAIGDAGISKEVPQLPSLTLGAFELSLAELVQGYATLARFGAGEYVHTLTRVESLRGELLFAREPTSDLKLEPAASAVVVGMLRQTMELGTGRGARAAGLLGDYAGKTGTTSDTKDAWFVGFDGRLLTAVWVGYDDNTPMGLTGAGAALPIWTDVNKRLQGLYEPRAFAWPSEVEDREVSREEVTTRFPNLTNSKSLPEVLRLVFAR